MSATLLAQDHAVVGNVFNAPVVNPVITQNFNSVIGKSLEYAELKKRLETCKTDAVKQENLLEEAQKDKLPQKFIDDFRQELKIRKDRLEEAKKMEKQFRQDVLRLAELLSEIEINSERLRLSKTLFDEGKIREADAILDVAEMTDEAERLLEKKEQELKERAETDRLLQVKADEFLFKANSKIILNEHDVVETFFDQSIRYFENFANLSAYGDYLYHQNQHNLAITYFQRCLSLKNTDEQQASCLNKLGQCLMFVDNLDEAENMFLQSLEIRKKLAKNNPAQFEPALAGIFNNLGNLYKDTRKPEKAKKMYNHAPTPLS